MESVMSIDNQIGWGIIGCGNISAKFAEGLAAIPDARLVACAARDSHKAAEFATSFAFEKSHASYADLAADPNIDVVYIGTIHPAHFDNAMLCIENGKSVLCEKPFAINAKQSLQMIDAAAKADVYIMEAMWTRFIPAIEKLNHWLADEVVGELSSLTAEFGFFADFGPDSRLYDIALGGGALLDVGIYPVSFASMVFGQSPTSFKSYVQMGPTGVDIKASLIMEHADSKFANLAFAVNTPMSNEATICGKKGYIRVGRPFWHPQQLTLHLDGQEPEVFNFPFEQGYNGYTYEAKAVMQDIRNSKKQNKAIPLAETLEIMNTLDKIRKEWNFKYPCE
jgi:dihydrodiol dehydrogenase / D-xylose 1-dehydrogenase (NADP)